MDDNYSDEIGENFEEEYIDDDYQDVQPKKQAPPAKNDLWEAPKKAQPVIAPQSQSTLSQKKTSVLPSNAITKVNTVVPVQPVKGVIKESYALSNDDDYEDEDFDNDEEENFKVGVSVSSMFL